MAARPLAIKIKAEDTEVVSKALKALGTEGEEALKRLEKQATPTAAAFRKLEEQHNAGLRAARQFNAELALADRALRANVVSASQHATVVANIRAKAEEAAAAQSKFGAAVANATTNLSSFAATGGPVAAQLGALAPRFGALGLGVAGAAAAIAGVGIVLNKGREEFKSMELSTATFTAVLKATGNAAGVTAKEIVELADAMEMSTMTTAEGVLDAAAALATFKSVSGDSFTTALKLANDLSSVFGGDLKGAAIQLGKALEDPERGITALRKSGVSFTESQKEMIKNFVETGRQAEAARIILEQVAGQVGGAAEAKGQTLAGASMQAAAALGNVFENLFKISGIAGKAAEGIRQVRDAQTSLAKALEPEGPQDRLARLQGEQGRLRDAEASALESSVSGAAGLNIRGSTIDRFKRLADAQKALAANAKQLADAEAELELENMGPMQAGVGAFDAKRGAEVERLNARKKALEEFIEVQKRGLEVAGLEDVARKKAQAADEAEAKLKKEVKDATEEEIKNVRATAEAAVDAAEKVTAAEKAKAEALQEAKQAASEDKKLREEADKQMVDQIQKQLDAYDAIEEMIKGIRAETEEMKMNEQQRAISIALRKAEEAAIKGGIQVTDEQTDAIKRETIAKFNADAQKKANEEAAKDAKDRIEKQQKDIETQSIRMLDRVTDFGADALYMAFTGQISSIGDFLKQTLLRSVSQGLSEEFLRPVFGSLMGIGNAGGGAVSMFGNLFGGAQAAANIGGWGSPGWAGSTAIASGTAGGWGSPGWGGSDAVPVSGGFGFGNVLGSAALGAGIGTIFQGKKPGYGSTIGGALGGIAGGAIGSMAAGAALGSIVPGIGTAIGAVGGALLGGLFGPKKSVGPNAGANLFIGGGYGTSMGSAGADNKGDVAAASSFAGGFATALNALRNQYGLTLSGDTQTQFGSMKGQLFASIGGGYERSVYRGSDSEAAYMAVLRGLVERGNVSAPGTAGQILSRGRFASGSELTQALDFGKVYDQIISGKDATTGAAKAMEDLNKQFEDAKSKAEQYGLSVAQIAEVQVKAQQKLRQSFADDIEAGILDITDPQSGALNRLNKERMEAVAQAAQIGADINRVEYLYGLRRTQIVEQFAAQAASGFDSSPARGRALQSGQMALDFLNRASTSTELGVSADDALRAAQQQFAIANANLLKDPSSMGSFLASGEQLLSLGKAAYATGPQFGELKNMVLSAVQAAGQRAVSEGNIAQQIVEAQRQSTASITDAISETNRLLDQVRTELRQDRNFRQATGT